MDPIMEKARKQAGGATVDRICRIMDDNQHLFKSREHLLDFHTELKNGLAELYDEEEQVRVESRIFMSERAFKRMDDALPYPAMTNDEKTMATSRKINAIKAYRYRVGCSIAIATGKIEEYLHHI